MSIIFLGFNLAKGKFLLYKNVKKKSKACNLLLDLNNKHTHQVMQPEWELSTPVTPLHSDHCPVRPQRVS